jgi:hypothetical protein
VTIRAPVRERVGVVSEGGSMTGTCRAAVFRGDETYEIREFPIPDPPPGIDEAMALLARRDPDRDAVRVGLRHSHGAAS